MSADVKEMSQIML